VEYGVTADVTFEAWGTVLDELFASAADATVAVMVRPLDAVRPVERRTISVDGGACDLLLRRFLDELVY
jgi:SHS2 domain-containing protein